MSLLASFTNAHLLSPPNAPPQRVLGVSGADCDGAAVLSAIGPPHGEVRHQHQAVCLQRLLGPLKVRPLQSAGGWRALGPLTRLWLPEEPQHFQWDGSVHGQFVLITRERIERVLERPYAQCGIDRWGGHDFNDKFVDQLVAAMAQDCTERSPAGPLVVDSLVAALVHRLAATRPQPPVRSRISHTRAERVLAFIEAELHRPIGLDELAAQADVGVRQFCAAFRNAVGTSPHQHLLQRRVERAKGLLHEGALGLAEVAAAVGFSDQSQFTRTFSRIAGISPGRYRARSAAAD